MQFKKTIISYWDNIKLLNILCGLNKLLDFIQLAHDGCFNPLAMEMDI